MNIGAYFWHYYFTTNVVAYFLHYYFAHNCCGLFFCIIILPTTVVAYFCIIILPWILWLIFSIISLPRPVLYLVWTQYSKSTLISRPSATNTILINVTKWTHTKSYVIQCSIMDYYFPLLYSNNIQRNVIPTNSNERSNKFSGGVQETWTLWLIFTGLILICDKSLT